MLSGPPRRRRARPVADAPIDVLLSESENLTKGWLLALLEQAPLDDAPRILAADLTRDGPRVCEAMLRAIADDTDLRRLEPGGALAPLAARVGELAGATSSEATSQAVDALHGVVWAALRTELRNPDPDLVSELAERLGQVTELMRVAALRHGDGAGGGGAQGPALSAVPAGGGIAPHGAGLGSPAPGAGEPMPPSVASPLPRPEPSLAWADAAESAPGAEALWVGALQEEIRRTGGSPLSLLLAELEDAEAVLAVEPGSASAAKFGEFAHAVRGAVRRQDILVCETGTRAWIIARDTGRAGAQALGSRISGAVRAGQPWHGVPMAASVGVAVLGENGRSPAELIEAAEEARFAAAARGVDVIRSVPDVPPDL
jgi:GGDEF domain-containing protein